MTQYTERRNACIRALQDACDSEIDIFPSDEAAAKILAYLESTSPFAALLDEHRRTLTDLYRCFMSWEPQVRVLGNVRADDAANAIRAVLAAPSQPAAPAEQTVPWVSRHCQSGNKDVCRAGQRDGVACPEDSCDIDDGQRPKDAPATAAHAGAMLTDDEAALLTRIKHFHTHEFGRGPELHSDAIEDAYKKGRAAAPTPTATAPAALTDYRIKRMAADFWKVQNVMGVDSCMFDAVGFAHALLATNPDSTGVSK